MLPFKDDIESNLCRLCPVLQLVELKLFYYHFNLVWDWMHGAISQRELETAISLFSTPLHCISTGPEETMPELNHCHISVNKRQEGIKL